MADQILTLTYSTTTRLVTQSGLTAPMGAAMARLLTRNGIAFRDGNSVGRLQGDTAAFTAKRRASIITTFNDTFDQDPNPQHATDNFTLVLTAV